MNSRLWGDRTAHHVRGGAFESRDFAGSVDPRCSARHSEASAFRFALPCRQTLSWVSARPAAVGRGEGSPLEHSRFDPSPRPTAAPPCKRPRSVVHVSSELERCERVSAHSQQPAAGVGEGSKRLCSSGDPSPIPAAAARAPIVQEMPFLRSVPTPRSESP